jgi:hypothetical protein
MNMKKTVPVVTMMDLNAMDPAEARVLIAKDALKLIRAGTLIPQSGTYVSLAIPGDIPDDTQVHVFLEDALPDGCYVCALGAVLIATTRRFDMLTVRAFKEFDGPNESTSFDRIPLADYLEKFFSKKQLDLIEVAFEGSTHVYGVDMGYLTEEELKAVVLFRTDHDVAYSRPCLMAILQNIIDNNGTFVVPPRGALPTHKTY